MSSGLTSEKASLHALISQLNKKVGQTLASGLDSAADATEAAKSKVCQWTSSSSSICPPQ